MIDDLVRSDFDRARQKAFLQEIVSIARRQPNELLPFHEIRQRLSPERESYRGMQEVPIAQIVGSVDRYRDFNRAFLPKQSHTASRWKHVDRAYRTDVRLPPVQLYKVGDIYFVKDGNHRVSVARERGVEFIDAEVIEAHVRVPLRASMSPRELLLQVEYAEFLRITDLDRTRPDHHIQPTALGRYDILIGHVLNHHAAMQRHAEERVSLRDAASNWYDELYQPIVTIARERGVAKQFAPLSEADIYLWVLEHAEDLTDALADESTVREAAGIVADQAVAEARARRPMRRISRALGKVRLRRSGSTAEQDAT